MIRSYGISTIAGNHDLKVAKILSSQDACSTKKSSEYAYKIVGNKELMFKT